MFATHVMLLAVSLCSLLLLAPCPMVMVLLATILVVLAAGLVALAADLLLLDYCLMLISVRCC